jgi:hypothetical protein
MSNMFEAWGDLRPARTIFFEELIALLVIWRQMDSNIILLSDFNENVYSGRIAKHLLLPDLYLTKQCLQCTGLHILFRLWSRQQTQISQKQHKMYTTAT